jgi:hypothetical protein
MAKVFSIHTIHHRPDPKGPAVVTPPGVVFDLADGDAASLSKLGAVREPTENELQLHSLANRGAEAPAPRLKFVPEEPEETVHADLVDPDVDPEDADQEVLG